MATKGSRKSGRGSKGPIRLNRTIAAALAMSMAGLALGTGIVLLLQRPDNPRVLEAAFNVAVAEFGQHDGSDVVASNDGSDLTKRIYDRLRRESEVGETLVGLDVGRQNIGLLKRTDEAQEIGAETNATVTIWGTIADKSVSPNYFIDFGDGASPSLRSMEGHWLSTAGGATTDGDPGEQIGAIVQFLEGLSLFRSNQPAAAAASFDQAADTALAKGDGAEIYFTWAGAAYRQAADPVSARQRLAAAVDEVPTYGPAFLLLGDLFVDQALLVDNNAEPDKRQARFEDAIARYERAALPENQVVGRFVDSSARYGIGLVQFYMAQDSGNSEQLIEQSILSLGTVLADYERRGAQLLNLAYNAEFVLGEVTCRASRPEEAAQHFAAAASLAQGDNAEFAAQARRRQGEIGGCEQAPAVPTTLPIEARSATPIPTPTPLLAIPGVPTATPTLTPNPSSTRTPTPVPPPPTRVPPPAAASTPTVVLTPTPISSPVPTLIPTATPTFIGGPSLTPAPTAIPTAIPTNAPTPVPTEVPTVVATEVPTALPTEVPTAVPTEAPTAAPTAIPTTGQGTPVGGGG